MFLIDKSGQDNEDAETKRPLRRSCSTPLQTMKNRGKPENSEASFKKINENVIKTTQYFKRNEVSISPNSRRRKGNNNVFTSDIYNQQLENINKPNRIKNDNVNHYSMPLTKKDIIKSNKENIRKTISAVPLQHLKQQRQEFDSSNPRIDNLHTLHKLNLLSQDCLKEITQCIVYEVLVKEDVNSKPGTFLCKEVSTNIRDKLKSLIKNERKIVVTTYICPRTEHLLSGIHVSIKCQTICGKDECLTCAFEINNLVIWVTILVADY